MISTTYEPKLQNLKNIFIRIHMSWWEWNPSLVFVYVTEITHFEFPQLHEKSLDWILKLFEFGALDETYRKTVLKKLVITRTLPKREVSQ